MAGFMGPDESGMHATGVLSMLAVLDVTNLLECGRSCLTWRTTPVAGLELRFCCREPFAGDA
jgi:hypothetical protein